MKTIKTAFVLLEQDGKVLLIREIAGQAKGLWCLPGGHVNEGETVLEGAKREVMEEAGYEVRVGPELCVKMMSGLSNKGDPEENDDMIEVHVFSANILAGEAQGEEGGEVCWFEKTEAKKLPLRWEWLKDFFV